MLFLDDAKRFILHCRSGVDQAPLQVYSSALLFAPERSVIRETFQRHISWITTKPVVELNWSLCLLTLDGHRDGVESLAFSGDGRLASGSADQTVNIWDAATGALQRTLEGHDDYIMSAASSDDGRLLASSSVSGDKTIKVWDAATGALLRTLKVKDYLGNPLRPARFSSDGSHLLTEQGRVRLLVGGDASDKQEGQAGYKQASGDAAQSHSGAQTCETMEYYGCGISCDEKWITWNGQNMLWLPLDYWAESLAISPLTDTMALGCKSGRVVSIGFSSSSTLEQEHLFQHL